MAKSVAAWKYIGNGAKSMGIKLCEEGKKYMDKQRLMIGWNKIDEKWLRLANVSESTLKRFWQCKDISPDSFRAICKAVDVDLAKEWDLLIEGDKKDSTRVKDLKQFNDIYVSSSDVSITKFIVTIRGIGIFDEKNTQLIRQDLDILKDILSECDIKFPASPIQQLDLQKTRFTIYVNGFAFLDENDKFLVQDILTHLENLLIKIYVKIMPI